MNMGKLSWRICHLKILGFFIYGPTQTPIDQCTCTSRFWTRGLRSSFKIPAKSTDRPRHWHCERAIYVMHMMPSKPQFSVRFVIWVHKINFTCQVVYWPHMGGLWWVESLLYLTNGTCTGKHRMVTLLYYRFSRHPSPLLPRSYIFLLIVH